MLGENVAFDESIGTRIIAELDKRVVGVVKDFQASPLGQLLIEPDSSTGLIAAVIPIREVCQHRHGRITQTAIEWFAATRISSSFRRVGQSK